MLLGVAERLLLLNVMPPAEGDYAFLRSIRELRAALSFSPEETAEIGLKQSGAGSYTWDHEKEQAREIPISLIALAWLSKNIRTAPSLREEHFDFYSRFTEGSF